MKKVVERMNDMEKELLQAIHEVDKKVTALETKIDNSIRGQFKGMEKRIIKLENNQRWVVLAILGFVIDALMRAIIP